MSDDDDCGQKSILVFQISPDIAIIALLLLILLRHLLRIFRASEPEVEMNFV